MDFYLNLIQPVENYGISKFVQNRPKASGKIKTLPSDFIVREIDLEGNIAGIDQLIQPANGLKSGSKISKFTLQKSNLDTFTTLNRIKSDNKLPKSTKIKYAGMKDKIGVTFQFCTTTESPEKFTRRISSSSRSSSRTSTKSQKKSGSYSLSNFMVVEKQTQLGNLKGNQFQVVIRNFERPEKFLENPLDWNFQNFRFINYFGHQRFSHSFPSHLVGLAIFKQDYREAAALLLRGYS